MNTKKLGLKESTSLVLGNVIGTGILTVPISLAAYGSISLIGWLMTGIGAIILSLIFAALSRKYPNTGGPYAYSRKAFGDLVGFQVAWSHWIATWVGNASAVIALMAYVNAISLDPGGQASIILNKLYNLVGLLLPIVDPMAFLNISASLFIIWFLTWINTLGVNIFARVQNILTIIKITPLVMISILGVFYVDINNLLPLGKGIASSNFHAISAAAAITLYAFIGIESATIPADKVKDANITIPLATIIGTLLTTIIYLWISFVLFGIVSSGELAKCTAPFALAVEKIFGTSSGNIMATFGAFIGFSVLNGWIMIQGQIPLAAARDGLFPSIFARTNKHGLPSFGLVITSVFMSFLLLMNYGLSLVEQFNFILDMTVFSVLLPYLYSSVAYMYFVVRGKEKLNKYQLLKSITLSIMGFGYTIWMIISVGMQTVYLGSIFTLLGTLLFAFTNRKMILRS